MARRGILAFSAAVIVGMQGCSPRVDSVAAQVDVYGWDSTMEYSVSYDNRDTLSQRRLSVFVLHERDFAPEGDSLVLTITTLTPDSLVYSDEWTFRPQRPRGDAAGMFHETAGPYRSQVVQGRQGPYTFTFSHRNAVPIKGIQGIGITIDNEIAVIPSERSEVN